MSVAATQHDLEQPATGPVGTDSEAFERQALEQLTDISPSSPVPVIAVDLDDVLAQTNHVVAEWHNQVYGTRMDLSHFYYYYYWKNPFWGTPKQTFDKVKAFYQTPRIFQADPVPGAREGTLSLKDMGFKLIIVTARAPDTADESWMWVNKHFPGVFDSIICTGQFKDVHKTGHEVVTKLSKAQVCADLNARILIDDSSENALQCATAIPIATRVLLFGDYEWNKRVSGPGDASDDMSFDIRLKALVGKEFWKEETVDIPEGAPLERVKDWSEVVRWVKIHMDTLQ
ncbi:uncharacterized protein BT62DRAFT_927464 [Guyanagaster necrorhizus]|uniref:Uncharacterized protein n=1 Tax=Guyanagaster necrorhizus TaxID=856835 RepID=A0A9P8AWB3_9AGAR|nr:uncharacterized protein BT62DRAFT_927464 [Guyanagaster necrorhizus MCA 3950]KAG7450155.1 hypothetical protein BT62DRAFT_927464 [Guyanagaster necrorhizus MCA 3950]